MDIGPIVKPHLITLTSQLQNNSNTTPTQPNQPTNKCSQQNFPPPATKPKMLFTSILFSALAVTSGAFAKSHNVARQAAIGADEVKILFESVEGGGGLFTLDQGNFPETLAGPAGLFNGVSFDSGANVDPALRCRIFSNILAREEDVILVDRNANLLKNSFSKGASWTFSNGVVSPIGAVQCAAVENVFFTSPE